MDIPLALAWIRAVAASMNEHVDQLTRLDAAIGDADHGANMRRGFGMVVPVIDNFPHRTVGQVLIKTGSTLVTVMGGAAGPLYGSAFRAAGKKLGAQVVTPEALLMSLYAGLAAIGWPPAKYRFQSGNWPCPIVSRTMCFIGKW